MNIQQIRISSVLNSLAGVVLLGTITLFGYELRKPEITLPAVAPSAAKSSPLTPPSDAPEQLHRLPQMPDRFQRRVIYYGARRKYAQVGNNFTKKHTPGKVYMALNVRTSAEE